MRVAWGVRARGVLASSVTLARLGCKVRDAVERYTRPLPPIAAPGEEVETYLDVCKGSNTNTSIAKLSDEELVDDNARVDAPLPEFGVTLTGIRRLEHCLWWWCSLFVGRHIGW